MVHLQRISRSLVFTLAATLAACAADDNDDSFISDGDARDTSDDLRDEPPEESRLCLEIACESDQVCVVPPLHCDDSGDTPVLRRDDAFCRPLTTGDAFAGDSSLDLTIAVVASQLCDDPQPIGPDEGHDGSPIGLRCPDIDLTCEQL